MRNSLFIAAATCVLGACAEMTPPPAGAPGSGVAPVDCCASLQSAGATSLERGKPRVLELDKAAPQMRFPQGVSLLAVVQLPTDPSIRRLLVKSHPQGIFVGTTDLFCPSVEFLSASGETILSVTDLPLMFKHEMGWNSDGFYFASVDVPATATRAVFHTSQRALSLKVPYPSAASGHISFATKTPIYVDSGYRGFSIPCVATGRLEIEAH